MYLSRIALNSKRRETMRALSSPQILHGAVECSFDGDRQRNLWRIDWLNDICYLLILSAKQGDFMHIVDQFGYKDSEWQTKNYDPFLSRLKTGQIWQFRLSANPTRSSFEGKNDKSERGKVFAHVTQDQQKQWLLKRSQTCGFLLDESGFDVTHSQWLKFSKNKKDKITLHMVAFEGILTISDVECFKQSLLSGIGREKAYGCGLLTLAHIRGVNDGKDTRNKKAGIASTTAD
ncbi:type I-E CRISPR-associated protein Cas6/Cse3/CasE [Eubacteriales bacterium mix99]|jgi:CRISPR system Cascade subunit CasE